MLARVRGPGENPSSIPGSSGKRKAVSFRSRESKPFLDSVWAAKTGLPYSDRPAMKFRSFCFSLLLAFLPGVPGFLMAQGPWAEADSTSPDAGAVPEVAPVDLSEMPLDLFSDADLRTGWMIPQPLPYYLAHLAEVANSVVTDGDEVGWIDRRVWRSPQASRNRDPRVMEGVLSLAYFYTRDEPWNPYHGDSALRPRLELALRYYIDQLGEEGLLKPFPPDQHVGFRLASTMFLTKFLGETLVLLHEGPPIDPDLHADLLDAQRRALNYVFTSDLAFVQGRQFSNQYGNVFGGAYAYLSLKDDPEIERLLERSIREVVPHFQSPAGYLYENHSADFGYSLGTHHSTTLPGTMPVCSGWTPPGWRRRPRSGPNG